MTGFGQGCGSSAAKKITVEIKSLNSKQFDISMRVPPFFRDMEIEARGLLAKALERGKVDVQVTSENTSAETSAAVNIPLLAIYKRQLEEMAAALDINAPQDWYTVLLRMPDSMKSELQQVSDDDRKAFMEACKAAVGKLQEFRLQEGRKLYTFFRQKIENISGLLTQVDPFEEERVAKIRLKLEDQLTKMKTPEYDAGRLEQEMIFYIEKLDVTEEKQRLRSHLSYFLETLGAEEIPEQGQGKKLGFIAQEMGREINTLGSKSNNAEMQKLVVMMKDELEQIKEQVLNVL